MRVMSSKRMRPSLISNSLRRSVMRPPGFKLTSPRKP
jgi:hypothetical protein